MPADNELEPLDRWLGEQVSPLPPPDGTFELITRRARRRKIRKAVITVASAAAVAAAVAVAVPAGLSLRLSPSPVKAQYAAGRTITSSGTQGLETAGARAAKRPASPSAAPAVTAQAEPTGPVPANFDPVSVTFVSASTAWVIGQAGTPGQCANVTNPDFCTSIARTDDAGKTWAGSPAPGTSGPAGAGGVSGVRFLDGVNGWAFGPELWVTHDEGANWTQISTGGARVTDLETAGDRAYALFAQCTGAGSFADGCTSYTLKTSVADGNGWATVGSATTGLTGGGAATSGMITLSGTTGYLVAPDGTLYSGPIGGPWRRTGTMPCQPGPAQASGLAGQAQLALAGPSTLVTFCDGASAPTAYTSADGGTSWTPAGQDWPGITGQGQPTSITATSRGTIVLATENGIYLLTPGATGWKASSASGSAAPSGGFTYVGMTTAGQGVALPADTGLHEIWMTFDGGKTWQPSTSITPGN
jgi:hypothetical protein